MMPGDDVLTKPEAHRIEWYSPPEEAAG